MQNKTDQDTKSGFTQWFQGISFGVMDGIITVLGIMIGLNTAAGNRGLIIVGILAAGLADAFANAAGMHVSEETEGIHTQKEIWLTTISCFLATFLIVCLVIVPFLFLNLQSAVITALIFGILLLFLLGLLVGKFIQTNALWLAFEYCAIGTLVSVICYFIGKFVSVII